MASTSASLKVCGIAVSCQSFPGCYQCASCKFVFRVHKLPLSNGLRFDEESPLKPADKIPAAEQPITEITPTHQACALSLHIGWLGWLACRWRCSRSKHWSPPGSRKPRRPECIRRNTGC